MDEKRSEISKLKTYTQIEEYLDADNVLNKFYSYAAGNGVKRDAGLNVSARQQIRNALYGNIIYDALDMQDYISFFNTTDPAVIKAVEVLK